MTKTSGPDSELIAELAATIPTMTEVQLEEAVQSFRARRAQIGEVGWAGETLTLALKMVREEMRRRGENGVQSRGG